MSLRMALAPVGAAILALAVSCPASAQYSVIQAQRNSVGHSFFENIGVGFAGQFGNGGFFNFNAPAPNQFGGGNDGGGARFGFGGPNFRFNITADQGSSRTLTSTSPSVTIPNGGFGSIFSGSVRPFVTGIVPVVSQSSPVLERYHRLMQQGGLQEYAQRQGFATEAGAPEEPAGLRLGPSSAEQATISIAEIRHQQTVEDAAQQQEMRQLVADAERCIAEGKLGAARVYLQQAARRAGDSQRAAILSKLESIR
jgi:hypothetical protein